MARSLASKPNVDAPDYDYPYGRIRDRAGSAPGTPVNEVVYGDFHQFFAKLMDEGAVTANGLPDNDDDGFQLYEAFQKAITQWLKDSTATNSSVTTLASSVNLSSISVNGIRFQKHGANVRCTINIDATVDTNAGFSFTINNPTGFLGNGTCVGSAFLENITDGLTVFYSAGMNGETFAISSGSTITVGWGADFAIGSSKQVSIAVDFQYPLA